MFCPHCGAPQPEKPGAFCVSCGARLDAPPPPSQPVDPIPQPQPAPPQPQPVAPQPTPPQPQPVPPQSAPPQSPPPQKRSSLPIVLLIVGILALVVAVVLAVIFLPTLTGKAETAPISSQVNVDASPSPTGEPPTDSLVPAARMVDNYYDYLGSYAAISTVDLFREWGGPILTLQINGDYLTYHLSNILPANNQTASITGQAYMDGSPIITFTRVNDGWGNLVSGTIELLENGSVAVESNVVEYDATAQWSLAVPYTELAPCTFDASSFAPNPGDYILPSDTRYITREDLLPLTQFQVQLARNELFARHGYTFNNPDVKAHFMSKSWYHEDPSVTSATFGVNDLTPVEKENLDTILEYEREMGWD